MTTWEGPSGCIKCNSYRVYKDECQDCGTVQKQWYKENMISNLKQYGFKKSFFFNKWVLGDLVAKQHKDSLSTNMVIEIDGELKVINQYGNYKSFEKFMDNLIGKSNKRNLIIEEILK
jgi:hypothetical protein